MTTMELIEAYFAAWKAHDARQLAACFEPQGIFVDPSLKLPAKPYDLGSVMESLADFIPDFGFEMVSTARDGNIDLVQWKLTGANSRPLKPGIDATGKTVHLSGVDVIEFGDRGVRKATRFYDQKSLFEQIGMQVIVEPIAQGKATYGYSKRVASGNPAPPAVFATTWIEFKDQSELDHIRLHSPKIIDDFLAEPGFIGIVTGAAGNRAFTTTAWENQEALYHALDKAHARAKQDFRTGDLSPGVWTAVWKPDHVNNLWLRCMSCSQPNDMTERPQKCIKCGNELPDPPPYW